MTKNQIIAEIRRVAAIDGKAPGRRRFLTETGIRETDWLGVYWVRWGDAVTDAGLSPNLKNSAIPQDELLARLAALTSELGHYPIAAELKIKGRQDVTFPSEKTFRQFGGKRALMERLRAYCTATGLHGVAVLCEPDASTEVSTESHDTVAAAQRGFVYLVRHGLRMEFKIGRTSNPVRRQGEIRTELPEQLEPVHQIETDDAPGVERYWHSRFAAKRKNGEWFALDANDVRAFKKWKRIH